LAEKKKRGGKKKEKAQHPLFTVFQTSPGYPLLNNKKGGFTPFPGPSAGEKKKEDAVGSTTQILSASFQKNRSRFWEEEEERGTPGGEKDEVPSV